MVKKGIPIEIIYESRFGEMYAIGGLPASAKEVLEEIQKEGKNPIDILFVKGLGTGGIDEIAFIPTDGGVEVIRIKYKEPDYEVSYDKMSWDEFESKILKNVKDIVAQKDWGVRDVLLDELIRTVFGR